MLNFSRNKNDWSQFSPISLLLGMLLSIELGCLVWFVKFETNEGWYALYPAMVLNGELPYRDFFYHRLPFLPYFFTPATLFPFSTLISIRIISAICAWFAWWFSAAAAARWTNSELARVWVLTLGLASIFGNSYLITAQSYAPFAVLLALALLIISGKPEFSSMKNFITSGLLFAGAMGLRFGPDPLFFSVPIWLVLCWYLREPFQRKGIFLLGVSFFIGLLFWFSLGIIWDSYSFIWGVFIWPFKFFDYLSNNGLTPVPGGVLNYLIFKTNFVIQTLKEYLPLFLFLFVGYLLFLIYPKKIIILNWIKQRSLAELLAWSILLGNLMFFLVPSSSGVMQFSFVLPLGAACITVLVFTCLSPNEMSWNVSEPVGLFIFLGMLIAGLLGNPAISCSLRTPGSDVKVLGQVGDQVRSLVKPYERVLTFDPILIANAGRKIFPGLEFELFGFYPKWKSSATDRLNLVNWASLKSALSVPNVEVVILSDRRWVDRTGMGKLLLPYKKEISDILSRSWVLIEKIENPRCVGVGSVSVYRNKNYFNATQNR